MHLLLSGSDTPTENGCRIVVKRTSGSGFSSSEIFNPQHHHPNSNLSEDNFSADFACNPDVVPN